MNVRPEAAAEFVAVINEFNELCYQVFLDSGFELSPSEQEDLFQEFFIDQWEAYESSFGNTEQPDDLRPSQEDVARFFGDIRESDVQTLRDIFLRRTWKIEAKELKSMREQLGMQVNDVAASLDIKPAQINKLENAKDFNNRDRMATFLRSFYQMRLN